MVLSWITCGDDQHWCSFLDVNLAKIKTEGVYIIWHEGNPGRVVYVGQGDVSARLAVHRTNPEILDYEMQGTLRVTWAAAPAAQRDGIERYLADTFDPLVAERHPDVSHVTVNSPFQ